MATNKDYASLIDFLKDESEMLVAEVSDTEELTGHILSFFDKAEKNVSERELRYIYNVVSMLLRVNIDRIGSHKKSLEEIVARVYGV